MPAAVNGLKKCIGCLKTKTVSDFHKNKSRKDGLGNQCKNCAKKTAAKWRKRNKKRILDYSKSHQKEARFAIDKSKYGLTREESDIVENLRINGYCFICNRSAKEAGINTRGGVKKLCLDHEHLNGDIRGILCNDCNRFEGLLKKQMQLGIITLNGVWRDYLENPPGISRITHPLGPTQ